MDAFKLIAYTFKTQPSELWKMDKYDLIFWCDAANEVLDQLERDN